MDVLTAVVDVTFGVVVDLVVVDGVTVVDVDDDNVTGS